MLSYKWATDLCKPTCVSSCRLFDIKALHALCAVKVSSLYITCGINVRLGCCTCESSSVFWHIQPGCIWEVLDVSHMPQVAWDAALHLCYVSNLASDVCSLYLPAVSAQQIDARSNMSHHSVSSRSVSTDATLTWMCDVHSIIIKDLVAALEVHAQSLIGAKPQLSLSVDQRRRITIWCHTKLQLRDTWTCELVLLRTHMLKSAKLYHVVWWVITPWWLSWHSTK